MQRVPSHPRLILFALWLMVFSAASQIMIVAPILPRIAEQLDAPLSHLGSLLTIYALAVGVFALISGPISDRVGRRRILLLGTGLMAFALLLHGLARDFYSLLAFRGLAGLAGGVLSGAAVAYVGDYFPPERRGWANGWVMSGLAAGQIAGIPLGTLLAAQFGFQAPFLAFAVVMAATFALIWYRLPQPDVERNRERLTFRSALRGYGLLLKRSDVRAAAASFTLLFASISFYVVYLPTWLEAALGFTGTAIAGMYFLGGLANVSIGPQAGRLSDRIGRKGVIIGASLGVAVVMLLTPLAAGQWTAYGLFFVAMAFFASRASPLQALLTEMVPGHQRGTLMSLTLSIGQVGFALGSGIAGPVYGRYGYPSNTFLAALCALGLAGLVWRYLPESEVAHRRPVPAPEIPPNDRRAA